MLRVIAGEAKGRKLLAPEVPGLRPTSERVREAMFDILEARQLVEDAVVLDLFSGSGAIGIEALSRGAAGVTFVEQDRRAVQAIEHNLGATGYLGAPGVKVARADALSWLSTYGRHGVDLAFADPPYDFSSWAELLGLLCAATVLVEHRSPLTEAAGFAVSREYRYGGTLVTLLQATPGATAADTDTAPSDASDRPSARSTPDPPDPDPDPRPTRPSPPPDPDPPDPDPPDPDPPDPDPPDPDKDSA